MDHRIWIFNTLQVLDALITTVRNDDVGNPDGDDCLRFLSPEDGANIKSIVTAHRAPMSAVAAFYDWSVGEIYEFWLAYVRPPVGAVSGDWTSFTSIVLDANSAKDGKCIVCCDAPDIGERGDEVVLKSVRMPFAEVAVNMVSFEMMTKAPSEAGKGTALSVMPPAWLDMRDSPPGQMIGKIATQEYASAAKRKAFLQAEADGIV
jgi:hypothetical protein